ncbi:hypothetical protein [Pedobacter sp. HDW13]|nr:hypothetical protein [Pedobacter sp. HDW13]
MSRLKAKENLEFTSETDGDNVKVWFVPAVEEAESEKNLSEKL